MNLQRERVSSDFIVRRATASDAAAIHSILAAAFAPLQHLYTPDAYHATVVPESGVIARLHEGPIWIGGCNGAAVGTVSARCDADAVFVRGMAVLREARGRGLGQALLHATEDFARQQGRTRMFLYTTAFLHGAIRLYHASGFAFTGDAINPHGTELLQMAKELRP